MNNKKYKVGYTTGVFDLFHIGHLNILRRAKELCDFLIVAVNTDELVLEYKNKTPVIPYEERKAIVEAIRYVDKVVPQITLDKMKAWKQLQYNVLIQGDDWKGSPRYENYRIQLDAVGVDLIFLQYTEGISTTTIRKKLGI